MAMFLPIYGQLTQNKLVQLFDDGWRPTSLPQRLKHLINPKEARIYIQRVLQFYEGAIETSDITKMPR